MHLIINDFTNASLPTTVSTAKFVRWEQVHLITFSSSVLLVLHPLSLQFPKPVMINLNVIGQ